MSEMKRPLMRIKGKVYQSDNAKDFVYIIYFFRDEEEKPFFTKDSRGEYSSREDALLAMKYDIKEMHHVIIKEAGLHTEFLIDDHNDNQKLKTWNEFLGDS